MVVEPAPEADKLNILPPGTVLITGASGGLGKKLVDAFVQAGATRVIAASRRAVSWNHPQVVPIELDVTNDAQVLDAATRHAHELDILINNAGYNHNTKFLDVDADNARSEMEVNYFGTLRVIRAFAPAMRKRRSGTIINIMSVGSHISFPNMGSYCASKSALHILTQSVRAELSFFGIDVIGIYPPAVDTPMSAHVPATNKIPAELVASHVLDALRDGIDDVYVGPAAELYERIRREPKVIETMLRSRVAPFDQIPDPCNKR